MLRSTAFRSAPTTTKIWSVYLSGEIHSDWRSIITKTCTSRSLPISFTSPNTSHADSDDCGPRILGTESTRPNWDSKSSKINSVVTSTAIKNADIVVVLFGEKYRQWNAAYDAGYATAIGKPVITIHPPEISHMLKEVNSSATAVCETPEEAVDVLSYVVAGDLPVAGEDFLSSEEIWGKGNKNP